jgi:hypothetical protein
LARRILSRGCLHRGAFYGSDTRTVFCSELVTDVLADTCADFGAHLSTDVCPEPVTVSRAVHFTISRANVCAISDTNAFSDAGALAVSDVPAYCLTDAVADDLANTETIDAVSDTTTKRPTFGRTNTRAVCFADTSPNTHAIATTELLADRSAFNGGERKLRHVHQRRRRH